MIVLFNDCTHTLVAARVVEREARDFGVSRAASGARTERWKTALKNEGEYMFRKVGGEREALDSGY